VCDALGLDTSDYSFRYAEKIKETGERAVSPSNSPIIYSARYTDVALTI
jgi:hypothetical protein